MDEWLNLRPVSPLYRAEFADGRGVDVHADTDRMADEIERLRTGRGGGVPAVHRVRVPGLPATRCATSSTATSTRRWTCVDPNLARLAAVGGFRRLAPKVERYLSATTALRRVYSFQAMYAGLSPYDALAIYAVIAYRTRRRACSSPPAGCTRSRSRWAAAAEKHGVEIRYSTPVEARGAQRRSRDGGRDGRPASGWPCDAVVLNPDLPVAYRELLGFTPRRVRRLRYSPSCWLLLAGSRSPAAGRCAPHDPLRRRVARRAAALAGQNISIFSSSRPVRPTRCCAGTRHWPVVFNRICQRDGPTGRQIRLYIIACNPQ